MNEFDSFLQNQSPAAVNTGNEFDSFLQERPKAAAPAATAMRRIRRSAPYDAEIARLANQYGIPEPLFYSLVSRESAFNPKAVSKAGAYGLTQLMPGTAAGLGVDPKDPIRNLEGGARYLAQQYKTFGSWDKALAAYNAGPGAVKKYGGIPPNAETQAYVRWVLGNAGMGEPGNVATPKTAAPAAKPAPAQPKVNAQFIKQVTAAEGEFGVRGGLVSQVLKDYAGDKANTLQSLTIRQTAKRLGQLYGELKSWDKAYQAFGQDDTQLTKTIRNARVPQRQAPAKPSVLDVAGEIYDRNLPKIAPKPSGITAGPAQMAKLAPIERRLDAEAAPKPAAKPPTGLARIPAAAARGFQQGMANVATFTGTPATIAAEQNALADAPVSEGLQALESAPSAKAWWAAVKQDRGANVGEMMLQNLVAQATGLVGGAVAAHVGGPWAGAAAAGLGSLGAEAAPAFIDSLRKQGYDVTDSDDLARAFDNPDAMYLARYDAIKNGVPRAAVDAFSFGIAGKFTAGAKGIVSKLLTGAVESLVVQPALGGAGEALGQLIADGRITSVPGILSEIAAEVPGGGVETAVGTMVRGRAPQAPAPPRSRLLPSGTPISLEEMRAFDSEGRSATSMPNPPQYAAPTQAPAMPPVGMPIPAPQAPTITPEAAPGEAIPDTTPEVPAPTETPVSGAQKPQEMPVDLTPEEQTYIAKAEGKRGWERIKNLVLRPDIFQFRRRTSPGFPVWKPEAAGRITVWRDVRGEIGEPNQLYVVNGHHRVMDAQRFNDEAATNKQKPIVPGFEVRYLDNKLTAKKARMEGVLENLRESPEIDAVDVARYLRETRIEKDLLYQHLKENGVEMQRRGPIINDAVNLASLPNDVFEIIHREADTHPEYRRLGVAITQAFGAKSVEVQSAEFHKALADLAAGKKVTPEVLAERAKILEAKTQTGMDFGNDESVDTRARVVAAIKKHFRELVSAGNKNKKQAIARALKIGTESIDAAKLMSDINGVVDATANGKGPLGTEITATVQEILNGTKESEAIDRLNQRLEAGDIIRATLDEGRAGGSVSPGSGERDGGQIAPATPAAAPEVIPAGDLFGLATPEVARPKPLHEMKLDELYALRDNLKLSDEQNIVQALGEEGAKRWKQLERQANSTLGNPERASRAQAELDRIAASFTPEQDRLIFGIGEEVRPDIDTVKDYINKLETLDTAQSPEELGAHLRRALIRLAGQAELGPQSSESERMAFAELRRGAEITQERGWDANKVFDTALANAAAEFGDLNDASFLLGRFFKQRADARAQTSGLPAPEEPTVNEPPAVAYETTPKPNAAQATSIFDRMDAEGQAALERLNARMTEKGEGIALFDEAPDTNEAIANLRDAVTVGRSLVKVVGNDFKAWSTEMVNYFGEWVREHLPYLWSKTGDAATEAQRYGEARQIISQDRRAALPDLPDGERYRNLPQTVADAPMTPPAWAAQLYEQIPSYVQQTNEASLSEARERIAQDSAGGRNALDEVLTSTRAMTAQDTALVAEMLRDAIRRDDMASYNNITLRYAEKMTQAGQAIQAVRIIKLMTPEGLLLHVQRKVANEGKPLTDDEAANVVDLGAIRQRLQAAGEDMTAWRAAVDELLSNPLVTEEERTAIPRWIDGELAAAQGNPHPEIIYRELTEAVDALTTALVERFLRNRLTPPTFWDKLTSYYYSNILSGVPTQERNAGSNVLWGLAQLPFRFVRAVIDRPMARLQQRAPIPMSEPAQATATYFIAIPKAARHFLASWNLGYDPYSLTQPETAMHTEFRGGKRNPFNWVRRLLTAADVFSRTMGRESELVSQAMRTAADEGKTGTAFAERVDALLINPTDTMIEKSLNFSRQMTFTAEQDFMEKAFTSWRNAELPRDWAGIGGMQPGRAIVPFLQVPYQIAKAGLSWSPAGLLNLVTPTGRANASAVASRMLLGSVLMAALTLRNLGEEEKITLRSPRSDSERDEFYRLGKQPYSVKIGDTWIPYTWLGAFALHFATAAAIRQAFADGKRPTDRVLWSVIAGVAKQQLESSPMSGVNGILSALEDSNGESATRLAGRMASGLIPFSSLLRNYAFAVDPYLHEADSISDAILTGIPYASRTVPQRLDFLGRPVQRTGQTGWQAFSIVRGSGASADPLDKILLEYGVVPLQSGEFLTINGQKLKLTVEQARAYRMVSGAAQRAVLEGYVNLDATITADALHKQLKAAHDAAAERFKMTLGRKMKP